MPTRTSLAIRRERSPSAYTMPERRLHKRFPLKLTGPTNRQREPEVVAGAAADEPVVEKDVVADDNPNRYSSAPGAAGRFVAQQLVLKPYVWSALHVHEHGRRNLDGLKPPFIAVAKTWSSGTPATQAWTPPSSAPTSKVGNAGSLPATMIATTAGTSRWVRLGW